MKPKTVLKHFDTLRQLPHPYKKNITESRQFVWAFGAGCFFSTLCCEFSLKEDNYIYCNFFSAANPDSNKLIYQDILCYPPKKEQKELDSFSINEIIYATEMFYRYSLCHTNIADLLLRVGYKLTKSDYTNNPQDLGYLYKWITNLVDISPYQFKIST